MDDYSQQDKVIRENLLMRVLKEIDRVSDEPRLLVLVAHGFVELGVNLVVDEVCKYASKMDGRDFTHSMRLIVLAEKGLITDHEFRLLNWFRKLRNKAAHQPTFQIEPADMQLLAEPFQRDPKNFKGLCQTIVMEFFAMHANEIIQHVLASSGEARSQAKTVRGSA